MYLIYFIHISNLRQFGKGKKMTKKEILEEASSLFSEKGYNVTLTEIANAVGIKKQSIYFHFKEKDELMFEIIQSELLHFYSSKSIEFDQYMELEVKEALKLMFFSICDYYRDIRKLRFWRWILLIESKDLFYRCRDMIRSNQANLYDRIRKLLVNEFSGCNIKDDDIMVLVQTFVVIIHGVLDGMLLYHDIYEPKILIENSWNFFWNSIENQKLTR